MRNIERLTELENCHLINLHEIIDLGKKILMDDEVKS